MRRWIALLVVAWSMVLQAAACQEANGEPASTATVEEEAVITIGDAVTGVPKGYDPAPFSLTLLSCFESKIAVNGPYGETDYYTFTAQPDMEFLILQYRLDNFDVREHDTPYVVGGEVLTEPSGYLYRGWKPPSGINSKEYMPRPATQQEIDALWGDAGAFETLLPGESTSGRVVFELPADAEPLEATLVYVPAKIILEDKCR